MLHHGGRLKTASAQYGIPLEKWLDLSTGINLSGYLVSNVPNECWLRLPEDEDNLEAAACDYYGAQQLLPVAGSQAAIQALPHMRAHSRVGVLSPGYAEHAAGWQNAGHEVLQLSADEIEKKLPLLDVLVLIHPCNPSGQRFSTNVLLHWHSLLAQRGGWLVVDEAFMDVTPEHSICAHAHLPGLVVMRSLGKFFGLAGARVGFVAAEPKLLSDMKNRLGPWTINAPARWVATQALQDTNWQLETRARLLRDASRMIRLLKQHGLTPSGGSALFQWHCTQHAAELHRLLAAQAVLTRLFDQPAAIRFGIPVTDAQWAQLKLALESLPPHLR